MSIVTDLIAADEKTRKQEIQHEHESYQLFSQTWDVLANAYDGTGGFMTGEYLWEFPREDGDKFGDRKKQARYHNYVESLVELYVRYLTRNVERTTASLDLEEWWRDVDGKGLSMGGYVQDAIRTGLSVGHAVTLVDKPSEGAGDTRATDLARPFCSLYNPLAVPDWIYSSRDGLHAIKLREVATPGRFSTGEVGKEDVWRFLVWDRETWARFDTKGNLLEEGDPHGLGRVPVEVFRPKRMKRHPFIGRPLIAAPLVLGLLNRASEEDEVLRNQAFSLFVVSVPHDASEEAVTATQTLLSQGSGTQKAVVVRGNARYETADMATAQTLRDNQQFLIRELYRMAHVPYQMDTRDVKSADAIRLEHAELNEMLRGMAQDLAKMEVNIARLFFGWQEPTEAAAERAFEAADVSIQYPDQFFTKELSAELEELATAASFRLGPIAERAIKRRVVRGVLADESQQVLDEIDDELEAGIGAPGNAADELRENARQRLAAFTTEGAA